MAPMIAALCGVWNTNFKIVERWEVKLLKIMKAMKDNHGSGGSGKYTEGEVKVSNKSFIEL